VEFYFSNVESFFEAQSGLEYILQGSNLEAKLLKALMSASIYFLEPFEKVTKLLEGDHEPTIHRVHLCYHKLENSLNPSPTDSLISQFPKSRGRVSLQEKFEINDIHLLACFFFNTKFKSLIPFSVTKRQQIHKLALSMLEECNQASSMQCSSTSSDDHRQKWIVLMMISSTGKKLICKMNFKVMKLKSIPSFI